MENRHHPRVARKNKTFLVRNLSTAGVRHRTSTRTAKHIASRRFEFRTIAPLCPRGGFRKSAIRTYPGGRGDDERRPISHPELVLMQWRYCGQPGQSVSGLGPSG
ncbi:hypothetical protein Trydic_g9099 [Trypoxylus dichotomus]